MNIYASAGLSNDIDLYSADVIGKDAVFLYVSAFCYTLLVIAIDYIKSYPSLAKCFFRDPAVADQVRASAHPTLSPSCPL